MLRIVATIEPSVDINTFAARSMAAAGGLSPKNLRASFVDIKRAVAGLFANISSTRSPSARPPPAGIFTPRTVFSPLSWAAGLKTKMPSSLGLRIVQPVKHLATSWTSFCV